MEIKKRRLVAWAWRIAKNNAFWSPEDTDAKKEVQKKKDEGSDLGAMDPADLHDILDSLVVQNDPRTEEAHKELCKKIEILDSSEQQGKGQKTHWMSHEDIIWKNDDALTKRIKSVRSAIKKKVTDEEDECAISSSQWDAYDVLNISNVDSGLEEESKEASTFKLTNDQRCILHATFNEEWWESAALCS